MTPAQKTALKAAIQGNATWNAIPNTSDGNFALAETLSMLTSPAVMGWAPRAKLSALMDSLDLSKYTPADNPPTASETPTESEKYALQLYIARLILIQSKQINLGNILLAVSEDRSLDAGKVNVRKAVKDAVIGLPAGAGGVNVNAGGPNGVNALQALMRTALVIEDILKAGSATESGQTAIVFGWEGGITGQDVEAARNS